MSEQRNTYMHMDLGIGRATIAIQKIDGEKRIRVAAAFCSPHDQFSRKKGRLIADGRLDCDKLLYILNTSDESKSVQTIVREALADAIEDRDTELLPAWAMK